MRILGSEVLLKLVLRCILGGILGYVWYLICDTTCWFLELVYGGTENIPPYRAVGLLGGFAVGMGVIVYHSIGASILRIYRERGESKCKES